MNLWMSISLPNFAHNKQMQSGPAKAGPLMRSVI
jgi:hypothetical protein